MQRRRAARREEVDGVAVALGLEELPHRPHFHEARGLPLHRFQVVEQLQRLGIALGQGLFEIPLVAQVPAIQHERVDVAPHFGQVRHVAHLAVEVRRGRNGNIGPHLGAATAWNGRRFFARLAAVRGRPGGAMLCQHFRALRRVHQTVHQPEPGHRVFGIAHIRAVGRLYARAGELVR